MFNFKFQILNFNSISNF